VSDERRSVERRLQNAGNDEANPWPDEPEEFDPTSLGPNVPKAPTLDEGTEVDEGTARAFWSAVILANAGLFAVSIGPMLAYFQGQTTLGAALFVVGAVALGRTYYIYRTQSNRTQPSEEAERAENQGKELDEEAEP
jgi:hypothetical protein